ncbi:MAG: PG0541 family transporter-associated protein [Armatimonadota bacterium]
MSKTGDTFDEQILLMICETNVASRIVQALSELDVSGYTSFGGVSGVGETGRHEGTSVWPGTNTIVFTVVADPGMINEIIEHVEELIEAEYARRPGFRAFSIPARSIV